MIGIEHYVVVSSILFVLGRVLHGIGMDADKAGLPRRLASFLPSSSSSSAW